MTSVQNRLLRLADLPLRSGLFVACCAVALAWETTLLARVPTAGHTAFYGFIFFATWFSYRLHALVRAKAEGRLVAISDRITTAIAFIGAAALLPAIPLREWPAIGVAALLAVAYSLPAWPGRRALRELGLVKIAVLAGVWTLITAYLPAHLATGEASPVTLAYLCARRFVFMFALCVAFDVRDAAADARSGIRTVAVRLGTDRSYILMRATLLAFAALVLIDPLISQPLGRSTVALLVSAAITWLAIEAARRFSSHRFYLGCVDGMMIVQCLLVVAARTR